MPEFQGFPKIARLNRDIVITEKIDGTNAAVGVTEDGEVYAQSRTRIITPKDDNFGFARWVTEHADKLAEALGPGLHFGEWYGLGIQRNYGLDHKRFALFNTGHWDDLREPLADADVDVVPVLYQGPYSQQAIDECIAELRDLGSMAVPFFKPAEGIVVYHVAARQMFKVTLENDASPKGVAAA